MREFLGAMGIAVAISAAPAVCAAQDFSNIRLERVLADLHYAEGPVWNYDGFLVFSDTPVDKLMKWIPGQGPVDLDHRAGGAFGNAYDRDGRLYTCESRDRRVTRIGKNGKIEVLAASFEGKKFNAPNDIVVRRDGHVYFTDPAFGSQQDARQLDFYGVFHITPRGELDLVAKWQTRPNGITVSPDGKTLYVSDSDDRSIRAYDLDGKGMASHERVVVKGIAGIPGGLRTDVEGNVYVASTAVYVYSNPADENVKLLGQVPLGEPASNLAFGEADLESLFITTRTSVYRARLGVKGALPY